MLRTPSFCMWFARWVSTVDTPTSRMLASGCSTSFFAVGQQAVGIFLAALLKMPHVVRQGMFGTVSPLGPIPWRRQGTSCLEGI